MFFLSIDQRMQEPVCSMHVSGAAGPVVVLLKDFRVESCLGVCLECPFGETKSHRPFCWPDSRWHLVDLGLGDALQGCMHPNGRCRIALSEVRTRVSADCFVGRLPLFPARPSLVGFKAS
jgi:hypothetical protein